MIKKLSCFIYIALISNFPYNLFAESEENIRILQQIKNEQYYDSGLIHSLKLEFKENSTYIFTYSSEGIYWYNEGFYSFNKDRIILKPTICKRREDDKDKIPCKETFGYGNCMIKDSPQDINFEKFLVCKSNSNPDAFGLITARDRFPFGLSEYSTKPGKIVIFKNHKISIINSEGITLTNVNIREEPNVKSKTLKFYNNFEDNNFSEFVPKNTKVRVIGKTVSFSKVQNDNNYWYLVDVGYQDNVWMFGEFVKIDE